MKTFFSLTRVNLISILAVSLVLAFSFGYFLVFSPMRHARQRMQAYEARQINSRKELIVREVEQKIDLMRREKAALSERLDRVLRYRATIASGFLGRQMRQGLTDERELLSSLLHLVNLMPWAAEHTEFLIIDRQTKVVWHSLRPDLIGLSLYSLSATGSEMQSFLAGLLGSTGIYSGGFPCPDIPGQEVRKGRQVAVASYVPLMDWYVIVYKDLLQ